MAYFLLCKAGTLESLPDIQGQLTDAGIPFFVENSVIEFNDNSSEAYYLLYVHESRREDALAILAASA